MADDNEYARLINTHHKSAEESTDDVVFDTGAALVESDGEESMQRPLSRHHSNLSSQSGNGSVAANSMGSKETVPKGEVWQTVLIGRIPSLARKTLYM